MCYSFKTYFLFDCYIKIMTLFLLYLKVRRSACQSLCTLTILSVKFAREALNLLMDMLNDDSVVVRLQALETMHNMAINGCPKIQEKHLHMVSFSSFINRFALCPEYKIVPTIFLLFETARCTSLLLDKLSIPSMYEDLMITLCVRFVFLSISFTLFSV